MDTLLIFKVRVGIKDMSHEQAQKCCEATQKHFDQDTIPNHLLKFYVIPDTSFTGCDIDLLYPSANALITQEELLDLLIANGTVPKSITEQIKKEINL